MRGTRRYEVHRSKEEVAIRTYHKVLASEKTLLEQLTPYRLCLR